MRLLKFWKDTGGNNDTVVQISITLSLVFWIVLGWKLRLWWLMMSAVLLGPLTGLVFGLIVIYLLCTFCNARDRR